MSLIIVLELDLGSDDIIGTDYRWSELSSPVGVWGNFPISLSAENSWSSFVEFSLFIDGSYIFGVLWILSGLE